jgi:cell division protein FtsI/penicillin-binding protein 2
MSMHGNPSSPRRTDAGGTRSSAANGSRSNASRIPTPPPSQRTSPDRRRPARDGSAFVAEPGKRALPIGLLLLVLYVALAIRLFYVQVVRHKELVETARRLRLKQVFIPARRGDLLDRNGMLLVLNKPTTDVILDPRVWSVNVNPKIGDTVESRRAHVVDSLTALLPGIDVAALLQKDASHLDKQGRPRALTVAQHIDPDVGDKIKAANLIGVGLRHSARRVAIDGQLAPHVLGFTGRDGVGLDGLEKRLDVPLTGTQGVVAAEYDRRGAIPGTIQTEQPVQNGRDIVLTLDSTLQNQVQQALRTAYEKYKAEAATAVVLDPKTGDILACANYPSFDVNARGAMPPAARIDRAVSSPYEPGSTLKIITVAAALEEKVVTPDSRFTCNGERLIGKRKIHCHLDNAFPHGHGDESLTDVIKNSCNVATAACAFKVGKEKLYQYEQAFGFGQRSGSGLPGESRGLLKASSTWSDMQLANVAFGQGIAVTPLQLAAAYATIANDGVYHRPRIVWGDRNDQTQALEPDASDDGRRVISAGTAHELQMMLREVVDHGTGKNAQLDGYSAGGKTGTAQIAEHHGYGKKFVASFIGMAPMNNPKFVILVAITDPKGGHFGAEVSAPVFKQIAEEALLDRRVPHDKSATPKGTTAVKVPLRDD